MFIIYKKVHLYIKNFLLVFAAQNIWRPLAWSVQVGPRNERRREHFNPSKSRGASCVQGHVHTLVRAHAHSTHAACICTLTCLYWYTHHSPISHPRTTCTYIYIPTFTPTLTPTHTHKQNIPTLPPALIFMCAHSTFLKFIRAPFA